MLRRAQGWRPLFTLLCAIAVGLQLGPVFLANSPVAIVLAALSSLPVALAMYLSAVAGAVVALAAVVALVCINAQEALIFSLTTAPLGLILGMGLRTRLVWWKHWLALSAWLAAGISVLPSLAAIAPLGMKVAALGNAAIAIYLAFAVLYSGAWLAAATMAKKRVSVFLPGNRTGSVAWVLVLVLAAGWAGSWLGSRHQEVITPAPSEQELPRPVPAEKPDPLPEKAPEPGS